jgi:hypothetical protein
MSLYEDALQDFKVMNRSDINDGYGGTATTWAEGATIKGAIVYNSSNEASIARSSGVSVAVSFKTLKKYSLYFHEVLKDSAGRTYRLIQKADLNKTPASAGIDMQSWDAEEWVIPNG